MNQGISCCFVNTIIAKQFYNNIILIVHGQYSYNFESLFATLIGYVLLHGIHTKFAYFQVKAASFVIIYLVLYNYIGPPPA